MGENGREWERMGENGREWERMGENGREWQRMGENGREWEGMGENEREWERMGENGREWERMGENGREWERMRENEREWERMGENGREWERMRENESEWERMGEKRMGENGREWERMRENGREWERMRENERERERGRGRGEKRAKNGWKTGEQRVKNEPTNVRKSQQPFRLKAHTCLHYCWGHAATLVSRLFNFETNALPALWITLRRLNPSPDALPLVQLFAVTSAAQVVQSSAVPNPKVSGQRCPGVTEVQVVGAATCGGPCGPCGHGQVGQVGQVGLAVQAVSMCQPSIMAKGHQDTKISCNVAMWHSSRPVTWLKSLTLAFPLTMASFRGHCGNMALGQEANGKAPKCCLQQQERHSGPIDISQVTRIITNANAPSSLVICLWNHAQAEWSSMIIRSYHLCEDMHISVHLGLFILYAWSRPIVSKLRTSLLRESNCLKVL